MADVADHPTFDVELVTPDGPVFQGDAHMLIVPGQAGEIGVLARHAPLVATLKAGSTRVHVGGTEILEFATGPGFFKVETAKEELEKLDAGTGSGDRWQLEQRIRHAENQLAVSGRTTG